jgi:hypothetical protein
MKREKGQQVKRLKEYDIQNSRKEYDIQNSRKNQNQNKTLFTHEMTHEKN